MTDFASNPPPRRRTVRRGNAEFQFYFAVIFILALPVSCLFWLRDILVHRTLNRHGPIGRAWAEADRITPLIFSV